MIVFKNYFKIAKSFIPIMILYTAIFTFFAVISSSASSNPEGDFTAAKPKVSIINNDERTTLIEVFTDYIEGNADIVKINNSDNDIRDALFFREVDYVLIIPKHFTEQFMAGLKPEIETMKVPDSYRATYLSMLLNRFLNVAKIYVSSGMDEELLATNVEKDLNESIEVTMPEAKTASKLDSARYYYNFSNYTLIAICVSIIGMIMNSFRNRNIKRRNLISHTSYNSINRSLFLSNLCIMMIVWLIYVIMSFFLYGSDMLTQAGLLMILNSFIFSITILSIGFLIGNLVKSKEAISGIVNVVALGSSFICGAFVPQQFLGDFVLGIARFLPSYWFIKNNNDIANLSIFNFDNLLPIFINMGIVLLFGLFFFAITNVVSKYKLKEN